MSKFAKHELGIAQQLLYIESQLHDARFIPIVKQRPITIDLRLEEGMSRHRSVCQATFIKNTCLGSCFKYSTFKEPWVRHSAFPFDFFPLSAKKLKIRIYLRATVYLFHMCFIFFIASTILVATVQGPTQRLGVAWNNGYQIKKYFSLCGLTRLVSAVYFLSSNRRKEMSFELFFSQFFHS